MAVRVVQDAQSATTVAVPPAVRSVAALLIGIGVPDADLDGVLEVLTTHEGLADHVPTTLLEVVGDCRKAYDIYLHRVLTIDAVSPDTPQA